MCSLVLTGGPWIAGVRAQSALVADHHGPVAHTCSATDRAFLNTATLNLAAIGEWGEEYAQGGAQPGEVVAEAQRAAVRVAAVTPTDPSLQQARRLMSGMFVEYAKAIQAKSRNRDAAHYLVRAYGLANFARDVLVQAKPGLSARGCDVSSLL